MTNYEVKVNKKEVAKGNKEISKTIVKIVKAAMRLENVTLKLDSDLEIAGADGKLVRTVVQGYLTFKEGDSVLQRQSFMVVNGREVSYDHGNGTDEKYKLEGRGNLITANSVLSKCKKHSIPTRVTVAVDSILKNLPLKAVTFSLSRQKHGIQIIMKDFVTYSSNMPQSVVYIDDDVRLKKVTISVSNNKNGSCHERFSDNNVEAAGAFIKVPFKELIDSENNAK